MIRTATLALVVLLTQTIFAQCGVSFPNDTVTIYWGYSPQACATLTPSPSGTAPFQYAWSNGDTTQNVTVCDTASGWYFVVLTDSVLCAATDSVFVNVVDVRCGNNPNNKKVLVCHVPPGNPANEHTICISENGVAAHLAHGCYLGTCASDTIQFAPNPSSLQLVLSPNPVTSTAWISISSGTEQQVNLSIVDQLGRTVLDLPSSFISAGSTVRIPLDLSNRDTDAEFLWIRAVGSNGDRASKAFVRGE